MAEDTDRSLSKDVARPYSGSGLDTGNERKEYTLSSDPYP